MPDKKGKTSLPFIRAYSFLLEKKDLKPAEKLVLITICRYWPSPFWGSNSTLALSLGYEVRFVQKIISKLKTKGYVKTGYAHKIRNGKNHTVRVIVPMCFEEKCKLSGFKIDNVQLDVARNVQLDTSPTSYRVQKDVQSDTLIERNRRMNREATPLPLPSEKQAKALRENAGASEAKRVKFSEVLSRKILRKTPHLTQREFEDNRQKQIKALLASS